MYNEERKQKFLSEINSLSTRKLMQWIFSASEKYERENGLDLAEMRYLPLQDFMNSISGVHVSNTASLLYSVKRYARWCKENGYRSSYAINSVEIKTETRIRERMVQSPEHLLSILDRVYAPSNTRSIDCVYRAYMWLAYAGLDQEQASRVESSDINYENGVICIDGEEYPIYPEAVMDIHYAEVLDEFFETRYRATTKTYLDYKHPRRPGKEIIRGKQSDKPVYEAAMSSYAQFTSKRLKALYRSTDPEDTRSRWGCRITFETVQLSGVYWAAYRRECRGEPLNFEEVSRHIAERRKKLGKYDEMTEELIETNIIRRTKELTEDYRCWKSAFNKD